MRRAATLLSFLMVFMIPWEGAVTFDQLGSLTRVIGLALAGLWGLSMLGEGRFRKLHIFHAVFLLFVLWNLASLMWTIDRTETQQQIETYVQLFVMVLILWDLYATRREMVAGMQAYVLGGWVTVGSTLYNYYLGVQISTYSGGRYSATGVNAVEQALILSLCLTLAWFLVSSSERRTRSLPLRILNIAFLPAGVFAILLTGSRTSLFTMGIALLYIFWSIRQIRPLPRAVLLLGLLIFVLGLQYFAPTSVLARLSTTAQSIAAVDLGGRGALWRASLLVFSQHPLLGVGAGTVQLLAGAVAHNTYISILAETGLPGFLIFLTLLCIVLVCALRQPREYAYLWVTTLAVWAVGVLSLSWEFRKPTWLVFILIVISASSALEIKRSFVQEQVSKPQPTWQPAASAAIVERGEDHG